MLKDFGIKAIASKNSRITGEKSLAKAIAEGMIFVYPTDTVYGIGCNALDKKAVDKVYQIKKRARDKPVSVIAPSAEWILDNFLADEKTMKKYFPGPYTLILKKKDKKFLSSVSESDSVGVRIPDCKFTKIIQLSKLPFVTTSANISGEKSAGNLKEIDSEVLEQADIVVEGDRLSGKPSTIVDLTSGKITKRVK